MYSRTGQVDQSRSYVYDSTTMAWTPLAQPATAGASGSTLVTVRQSTAADLNVTVAGYSTTVNVSSVTGPVTVRSSAANALVTAYQSTAADLNVTVAGYSTTVNVSSVTGPVTVRSSAANALVTAYQSTAADLNVTVAGYVAPSTTITVRQSTGADQQCENRPRPFATAGRSSVTQSSTNVAILAASTARCFVSIFNYPTQSAALHLKWGATASTTDYDVKIFPQQLYEMPQPIYTGQIDGIWDSTGAGYARIVEGTY